MALPADLGRAVQREYARYNRPMYRLGVIALCLVLAGLQYRLWIADGGWAQVHRLSQAKAELEAANDKRVTRNNALEAEIDDLKAGVSATEGRARADVGMVKRDESFFLTIAPEASGKHQASR